MKFVGVCSGQVLPSGRHHADTVRPAAHPVGFSQTGGKRCTLVVVVLLVLRLSFSFPCRLAGGDLAVLGG